MTENRKLYADVTALNGERDRRLSVKPVDGFAFARGLASAPLGLSEFADAAADMPIVFARDGEVLNVMAVMGVELDRNGLVGEDGAWLGRYVPAFLRRYPFILTEPNAENRQALCIDRAFEGLNEEDRGERLFDSEGSQTAYTRNALDFTSRVHAELMRTRTFAERLQSLGLLEDMEATLRRGEAEPRRVRGFSAVSREKLGALPDETLLELARSGLLEAIHLHLVSLKAFAGLDGGAAAKRQAEPA